MTANGSNSTLVSVVMPAYNAEETIEDAIRSVLKQSYRNIELIVVDDASLDDTMKIVSCLAKEDHRLRVYQNEKNSREGPIQWEPRNDGLKYATGEFIAYLDSDNTWDSTFIEELSSVLLSNSECVLVHCNSRNYYDPIHREAVMRTDRRRLLEHGACWTVFDGNWKQSDHWGIDAYIDTNEMLHRAVIFEKLGYLWATVHPRREQISSAQGYIRPARRHNDLDLFERVLSAFGEGAVKHHPSVLVNFYYESFRKFRELCQNDH